MLMQETAWNNIQCCIFRIFTSWVTALITELKCKILSSAALACYVLILRRGLGNLDDKQMNNLDISYQLLLLCMVT